MGRGFPGLFCAWSRRTVVHLNSAGFCSSLHVNATFPWKESRYMQQRDMSFCCNIIDVLVVKHSPGLNPLSPSSQVRSHRTDDGHVMKKVKSHDLWDMQGQRSGSTYRNTTCPLIIYVHSKIQISRETCGNKLSAIISACCMRRLPLPLKGQKNCGWTSAQNLLCTIITFQCLTLTRLHIFTCFSKVSEHSCTSMCNVHIACQFLLNPDRFSKKKYNLFCHGH